MGDRHALLESSKHCIVPCPLVSRLPKLSMPCAPSIVWTYHQMQRGDWYDSTPPTHSHSPLLVSGERGTPSCLVNAFKDLSSFTSCMHAFIPTRAPFGANTSKCHRTRIHGCLHLSLRALSNAIIGACMHIRAKSAIAPAIDASWSFFTSVVVRIEVRVPSPLASNPLCRVVSRYVASFPVLS